MSIMTPALNQVQIVDSAGNIVGTIGANGTVTTGSSIKVEFGLPTADSLTEAIIDHSTLGDNTIVAGTALQTIRVFRIFFVCDAPVNVIIKDGASTALTGTMILQSGATVVLDLCGQPWFTTSAGNAFVINLSSAVGIRGRCYYTKS